MSKVIDIISKCENSYGCLKEMIDNSVNGDLFYSIEKILEDNKEHINFKFYDYLEERALYDKTENHYKNFWRKCQPCKILSIICLDCIWAVTTKYNDSPLGEVIWCGQY